MKIVGIILIVLGVLTFIYTGFTYTKKEKVIDLGPLEVNAEKEKTVSWPPFVGGAFLLAGIVVIAMDKKK